MLADYESRRTRAMRKMPGSHPALRFRRIFSPVTWGANLLSNPNSFLQTGYRSHPENPFRRGIAVCRRMLSPGVLEWLGPLLP